MVKPFRRSHDPPRGIVLPFLLTFGWATTIYVAATPRSAFAQGATIGIYTDVSGSTCSFSGNAPGTITAYVVCRPNLNGASAVQFAAPVPPCLGAVIEEEIVPPGALATGSVETGIAIAFETCSFLPRVMLTIVYSRSGSTTPCCEYPLIADPTSGIVSTVDCVGAEVPTAGLVSHFNADASCPCAGNSQPTMPEYPIPPDNAVGQSVMTSMSWSSTDIDGNLAGYDVYLGTSPSPPLAAAGLPQPRYTPSSPLEPSTQYYWRVVARDALGLETSGLTWTFTTRPANSPPSPPQFPYPATGTQRVLLDITVRWQSFDIDGDSLVFDVYFGTSPDCSLAVAGLSVEAYSPGPLSYGTAYYWRVVARDRLGLEASGAVWTFVTRPSNFPPDPPVNLLPHGESTDQPVNVELTWSATDPENDPLVFDVYFGTPYPPPLVASGVSAKHYNPGVLAFEAWYHWRIVSRDDHGGVTSGSTSRFRTRPENYPPKAPSNPVPADGATSQLLTTTLAWQSSDPDGHAITYDVYFGTASPPPLVASNVATNSYAPGLLAFSRTYRWKIVARDEPGAVTSGPVWTFTTKANSAPAAPSSPNPPNNGAAVLSPTLSWTATDVDGQSLTYSVYFGTTSPPPLVASGLTVPTYAPGTLEVTRQYFWRVVASDGILSTSGPTWKFTAFRPGDVDADGAITLADASCALKLFVGTGTCAAVGGAAAADVDCSGGVTPRDARCIHKRVVDGSCPFCGESGEAPASVELTPQVNAVAVRESDGTIIVNLSVAGVPSLESFGFGVTSNASVQLAGAALRGASIGFTAMDASLKQPWEISKVGAYTISGVPMASEAEFVQLRFASDVKQAATITILGFVDDLAGANLVVVSLSGGGGTTPVLFTRFEAHVADGGVDVRWDLASDEAMESFTLYRREGAAPLGAVIAQGPVNASAGAYLDRSAESGMTYHYEMLVRTRDGDTFRSPVATVTTQALLLVLGQNHPNPFNPQTTIPYEFPRTGGEVRVRLVILDTAGRIVRTLVDEDQAGGSRQAVWDGRDEGGSTVSSGVYFYVLDAGGERRTRKLVLLK